MRHGADPQLPTFEDERGAALKPMVHLEGLGVPFADAGFGIEIVAEGGARRELRPGLEQGKSLEAVRAIKLGQWNACRLELRGGAFVEPA